MSVLGVGGIFFRADDAEALGQWYAEHLGVGAGHAAPGAGPADEHTWTVRGGPLVFAPFPRGTDYWPPDRQVMLNLRVDDLDGLLARLAAAGIEAETRPEWDTPETGCFARIHDPEGNPVELWQEPPPAPVEAPTEDTRVEPPVAGSEVEVLLGFLDYQRQTFARKTAGLSAPQLDQVLTPSGMTLGGMTKHLAYVEDWWCHQVLAGHDAPEPWDTVDWEADADWDWHSARDDDPAALRALHAEALARSADAVDAALALGVGADAVAVGPNGREGLTLRWILVHLVEEYSRHNGHADLLRESVDGVVGE